MELLHFSKSIKTGKSVLNARELHRSLKLTREYQQWIESQITKHSLVENEDYTRLYYDKDGNKIPLSNGRDIQRIDCVLTLNAAGKIAASHRGSTDIVECIIANKLIEIDNEPKDELLELEVETIETETMETENIPLDHPNLISSRQIAVATGKSHNNVLRDIDVICKESEGQIVITQNRVITDYQEAIVIISEYDANLGSGRIRKFKQYLLTELAAQALAARYDVKISLALLKLVRKMSVALAERPVQTIMLEARNMTFTETAELLGVNNRQLLDAFRKNRYLRQNNEPYDKYIELGYFAKERYKPNHSRTRTMLTSTKGFPLAQELMNKNVNLPEVIKQALPVVQTQQQASMLPAVQVDPKVLENLDDNTKFNSAMASHMIMAKSGVNNPIEKEKYMSVIRAYQAKYPL